MPAEKKSKLTKIYVLLRARVIRRLSMREVFLEFESDRKIILSRDLLHMCERGDFKYVDFERGEKREKEIRCVRAASFDVERC